MKQHPNTKIDNIAPGEFERPGNIRSLARGLRILSCFDAENPAWTLSDLARRVKLHRATVHRFVKTLEVEGFLAFDWNTGRYCLGSGAFRMANLCNLDSELARLARPHLERLAAASFEAVCLTTWVGDGALFLDMALAPRPFRPRVPVGQIFYDVRCSHCRVFLAHMPETARAQVLTKARQRMGESDGIDFDSLIAELERAAAEGIAFDLDGSNVGVRSVAAPIHVAAGRVKASLAVAAPSERFGPDELAKSIALIKDAAAALSRDLGYTG